METAAPVRSTPRRAGLAAHFRDAADPFDIVIVRDNWLTGLDCPSLSTTYINKPMRGHGLMQAIGRVKRVIKDKTGGQVVDYLCFADERRQALAIYYGSGGTCKTALYKAEAVALMP